MKKKILLLGANGQLGSDIRKVAADHANIELIAVTRKVLNVETDKIQDKLSKFLPVDYVINATSYHKTDECEDFPDKSFRVNASFPYELAKFCQHHDITLFHITTDYVFDGHKTEPYIETDVPNPINIYGLSKYAGEIAVRQYMEHYFIFRVSSLFGVAGASGKGGNFIETMLKMACEGKPIKVIDDQFMVPTHTLDIAKAILNFVIKDIRAYGIYHCVSNGFCSWYEFAAKIFELSGVKADLRPSLYADFKAKARRPKYSVLANAKLSSYVMMPSWENALKDYLCFKKGK